MNGIMGFCDWLLSHSIMFSSFIQVVIRISTLFLFKLSSIPLYRYTTFCLSSVFHFKVPINPAQTECISLGEEDNKSKKSRQRVPREPPREGWLFLKTTDETIPLQRGLQNRLIFPNPTIGVKTSSQAFFHDPVMVIININDVVNHVLCIEHCPKHYINWQTYSTKC